MKEIWIDGVKWCTVMSEKAFDDMLVLWSEAERSRWEIREIELHVVAAHNEHIRCVGCE